MCNQNYTSNKTLDYNYIITITQIIKLLITITSVQSGQRGLAKANQICPEPASARKKCAIWYEQVGLHKKIVCVLYILLALVEKEMFVQSSVSF